MFGQLHASPKRQQRLLERGACAGDQGQRRPTGGRCGCPVEQLGGGGGEVVHLGVLEVPAVLYLGHRLSVLPVQGHERHGVLPNVQRRSRAQVNPDGQHNLPDALSGQGPSPPAAAQAVPYA